MSRRYDPYPVGTPFWKYRTEKDEEEPMSNQSLLQEPHTPLPAVLQRGMDQSCQKSELPRLFWLIYDHSKMQTRNEWERATLKNKLAYWGILYPDGGVSLQTGAYFTTMMGLRNYLMNMGEFSIEWVKGGIDEQGH